MGTNQVMLPDGMATLMRSGTRIIVQSHYVNTGLETIRVQDGFNVELVEPDQVQTWAAPFVNAHIGFEVPAGQEMTVEFDCTFGKDLNLLYLYGHMHDWGSRFHVDIAPAGGTAARVYEVGSWEPSFRDQAPINAYDEGEFVVAADDVITTSCTWMNDTAGPLALPQEMCVTLGMAYPAQDAVMCIIVE